MSDTVIVAIISSVVAPTILFILQLIKDRREGFAMRLRRVEIMQNILSNPDDDQTIMDLYDEYRKQGGNSYICERIEEWKNTKGGKHGRHKVVKRRK